jgi:hypothetical protein
LGITSGSFSGVGRVTYAIFVPDVFYVFVCVPQCMIIRNTELAASREKFEEVEKRYKEVQANCSPPALIHKLQGVKQFQMFFLQCILLFPSSFFLSKLPPTCVIPYLTALNLQMPQMKLMKSLRACIVAF